MSRTTGNSSTEVCSLIGVYDTLASAKYRLTFINEVFFRKLELSSVGIEGLGAFLWDIGERVDKALEGVDMLLEDKRADKQDQPTTPQGGSHANK